ncbi:MAG: MYXO-CTERM sorting domain-containing protein [Pseudomonadota bacterium]
MRLTNSIRVFCFSSVVLATGPANAGMVTLQNDTYDGSSTGLFLQAGFISGERFGAVFTPPSYPFEVHKIQIIIAHPEGTPSVLKEFQLYIWEDEPGSKEPGVELYTEMTMIQSSLNHFSEINLPAPLPKVNAGKNLRIAFEQFHMGPPSIVRDLGPLKTKSNLIYGTIPGIINKSTWFWSEDLAMYGMVIQGNWIIRVIGDAPGFTPDAGPTSDFGPTPDGGQNDFNVYIKDGKVGGDGGGEPCMGCLLGPCYPNGTCNDGLECRSGVCVEKITVEEGGCGCKVDGKNSAGPIVPLLALGVLFLVTIWRRRK